MAIISIFERSFRQSNVGCYYFIVAGICYCCLIHHTLCEAFSLKWAFILVFFVAVALSGVFRLIAFKDFLVMGFYNALQVGGTVLSYFYGVSVD